jgi:hypothetical protein
VLVGNSAFAVEEARIGAGAIAMGDVLEQPLNCRLWLGMLVAVLDVLEESGHRALG